MATITVHGKTFSQTPANSAWFRQTSFTPEFYRGQADRAVAFLNAGLNPDAAEKRYNQMQYQYYKSASIGCESNSYNPSSSRSGNTNAYSASGPFSSSREIRFTRLIV
jgi:hypothetical protein